MRISELAPALGLETLQGDYPDAEVPEGYASDLLSDVMAHAATGSVLITIQAHRNTVAVASVAGCAAIVVCNSRPVPDDMVAAAAQEGIALFRTAATQFAVSGRLWALLGRS